jgi:hypothetical protein
MLATQLPIKFVWERIIWHTVVKLMYHEIICSQTPKYVKALFAWSLADGLQFLKYSVTQLRPLPLLLRHESQRCSCHLWRSFSAPWCTQQMTRRQYRNVAIQVSCHFCGTASPCHKLSYFHYFANPYYSHGTPRTTWI